MKLVSYGHAYVGTGWAAGGETTLHDLLAYLVQRGWDAEFILSEPARNGAEDQIIDGVKVRAYTDNQQPNRAIAGADLVISHLGGAQRSSIIAKNNKVPSVHVIHNDDPYTLGMSKHANFLIYNTEWILREFRNRKCIRPPGMVVRPPVNPENYLCRSTRKFITCINLADGTLHYDKGPKTFYEMAKRFPDEQFLGVQGAYGTQDLRSLPNVTLMDHTDDIKKAYRLSKVILSPSQYESYGRVPIEAACSGIPTVSSRATGFLESGIPVLNAEFGDYDAWEKALSEVLSNYQTYSKQAKVAAHTTWKRSEVELNDFGDEMLSLATAYRRNRWR